MELKVRRIAKRNTYTIGKLYIDGVYKCDTLEDKDRGLTQDMSLQQIKKIKVYAQTAIPAGRYKVIWSYSPRFKKMLPLLVDVPGFDGIRIHNGNTAAHTNGCILLGQNDVVGKVINSISTCKKILPIIQKACEKEQVYITIE